MTPDHDTPIIDLDRRHKTFTHGDLTVILTWFLHNGRGCLVIVPTFRKLNYERVMPCIVPLDHAYLWDEHMGDGAHCAQVSIAFARALGINPHEVYNLVRLSSIIREHLGDLITIPPMPQSEQQTVADVLMTNTNTGKTVEREIIDYV